MSDAAYKFGVRIGQTVAEARSAVAGLALRGLTRRAFREALGRVAEVALAFGPTASIDPGDPIETTRHGVGRSHGDGASLRRRRSDARRDVFARARARASRPRRHRRRSSFSARCLCVRDRRRDHRRKGGGKAMIRALPLEALPLSRDRIVWLHRLGLLTVGDLVGLPPHTLAGRLVDRDSTTDPWRESSSSRAGGTTLRSSRTNLRAHPRRGSPGTSPFMPSSRFFSRCAGSWRGFRRASKGEARPRKPSSSSRLTIDRSQSSRRIPAREGPARSIFSHRVAVTSRPKIRFVPRAEEQAREGHPRRARPGLVDHRPHAHARPARAALHRRGRDDSKRSWGYGRPPRRAIGRNRA